MAESYSVQAVLSALDKGFSSTLKNALGTTDSLSKKLTSGFNFGILTGAGQAAFNMITGAATGLISEVDSANAAWKTFASNMRIIHGEGKETEDTINSVKKTLQDYAQKTVYSSSDMASTYAQLAAVGTKNTDKLVMGFGGLAAAAENPQQAMKTLSQQATQMAAKPTVAWQDYKLMLEQTPAGMAAVAKKMGMSSAELVTAIQAGEVSTSKFFKAIEEVGNSDGFYNMATQAKTVGQAMDGLKETVGNKLTPAFDVLSQVGIKAINGLADSLGDIDADALASNISNAVKTAGEFLDVLKTSFSGVGTEVKGALSAIGDALGATNGEFTKTDALNGFKSACDGVAGAIKSVAGFMKDHADTIAKVLPLVGKLAGAFVGLKIINTIAPGVTKFSGALLSLAGKGVVGLAAKLFGVSLGQKAVGTASAASSPSVWQSAAATLALGGAVLMAAAGLALIVQSAIALASAGWPAVAALVALVGVIVGLALGAAAIGPALTVGAAGLIAFGAAIALVGVGVLLAAAGLAIIVGLFPQLIASGAQGAVAIVQLGSALALFAVGAALAGVAIAVLGAGLLVVASALLIAGAGMLLFGAGALLAAASLALLSLVMPTLAQYGLQGALAITALGGALLVFGAGALVAGAAALVLGAGLLVVAAAVVVLGAGMLLIAASALITAASLSIMAAILPTIAQYGLQGSLALVALCASMLVFAVGAGVAGAAALVLGAGLIAAAVGIALAAVSIGLLGAAMALLAVSTLLAAAGFGVIGTAILSIVAYGAAAAAVLLSMNLPLFAFVPAATAAGAAALILGAGLLVVGVAVVTLGVGVLALAAGTLIAAAALALLGTQIANIANYGTQGAASIVALGAALLTFAAGTAVMGAAIKGVSSSMKTIASNAKSAEKSLKAMQKSVDAVESGLNALGSKAKSAMSKLTSAFDKTANKAKSAGKKVGTGFTSGMQSGLAMAAPVATSAVTVVNLALLAGYASAYQAGAYISQGFARGMQSQLGAIRSAAAQMAAAADKAVRAKAKIASPSKVSTGLGAYWGEGFVNGITDMAKDAWAAAEELVSIPAIATPKLAMAYGGELSTDYSYSNSSEYTIEVPLTVDGKEFARATANYTQEELNRQLMRESRKQGKV